MGRRHEQRKSPAASGGNSGADITRLTPLGRTRYQQNEEDNRPLCRFFVLHKGTCCFGSQCAYSHTLPAGMDWEEAKTHVPCPFFARGACRYGEYCQLRHDPNDLVVKSCAATPAPSSAAAVAAPSSSVEEEEEEEEIIVTCGICLEDMHCGGDKNKFGLLSCCDHSFCFDCLMEWRKEGSQDASDRRCCPTCRKHSDYVVASRVFPSSEQQKAQIVQEYKNRLAVIPCRRYQQTQELGSCRFGSDCFYAHLDENGVDVKELDMSMEALSQARQERRRRHHRDIRTSLLGAAESTMEDIEVLLSFLRLLDLYGYQGVREIYWSDDEDDDDYHDRVFPLEDLGSGVNREDFENVD